jgi:hypothetical protein
MSSSRHKLDENHISVVGICYTGLMPSNEGVNTVEGSLPTEIGELYYNKAIRLSENDRIVEQLIGAPVWLDHDYKNGEFGRVEDAWITTTDEIPERFVCDGNKPPEGFVADKRVIAIRASLKKNKLDRVYQKLGVSKPKDIALSISYIYDIVKAKNTTTVKNKRVIEVSLCKLGFYQGCGICIQLHNDSEKPIQNWVHTKTFSNIIVDDPFTKSQKTLSSMSSTDAVVIPEPAPTQQTTTQQVNAHATEEEILAPDLKELAKVSTSLGHNLLDFGSITAYALHLSQQQLKAKQVYAQKMEAPANETITVLTETLQCSLDDSSKSQLIKFFKNDENGNEQAANAIHKLALDYKRSQTTPNISASVASKSKPDQSVLDNVVKMVSPTQNAVEQTGVSASANVGQSQETGDKLKNQLKMFASSGSLGKPNRRMLEEWHRESAMKIMQ